MFSSKNKAVGQISRPGSGQRRPSIISMQFSEHILPRILRGIRTIYALQRKSSSVIASSLKSIDYIELAQNEIGRLMFL